MPLDCLEVDKWMEKIRNIIFISNITREVTHMGLLYTNTHKVASPVNDDH